MIKFDFVKNANKNAKLPVRSTIGSAGYDFVTPVDFMLEPGESFMIKTDVKAYMPKDIVLQIYPRSSMGIKKDIMLKNLTGIIDSDYADNPDNEGNIGIVLYNYGKEKREFKAGDRIAQGIFVKFFTVDNDNTNGERTGGYGSTGK
jgi:dUTP pyrophosphatase